MEVSSFDSLAIELLKHGYIRIAYIEIYCTTHGGWRGSLSETSTMIPCPQCGVAQQAAVIAVGFTRQPGVWERWEKPLSIVERGYIESVDSYENADARLKERKRGRGRALLYKSSLTEAAGTSLAAS